MSGMLSVDNGIWRIAAVLKRQNRLWDFDKRTIFSS